MDPKTGFVIMRDDNLSNTRRRSLDLLYQPLLHPVAYTLINVLWQLSEISSNPLFQRPIHDLLSDLNVDMNTLQNALKRVEGAGLMKLFYKRDSYRKFYVFHLIQPLSARAFFREDLLSIGLLEMVGNQRFTELSNALIPKTYSFKGAHDLTRNFLEVYNVGPKHITDLPDPIKRARNTMSHKATSSLRSDQRIIDQAPDFDFSLLIRILANTYADVKPVKQHRHLILTEHALYGINELVMANYIEQATSVSNNQIDFKRFQNLIANAFQGNSRMPIKTVSKDDNVKDHSPASKSSHETRGLIKAADYYAPVQFLRHLKKAINPNGVVTHHDEWVIRQLMSYGAFRDNRGVINILTYYVIVDRQMASLKSNYMQGVLESWNNAKVNTPQEALMAIKRFRNSRLAKRRDWHKKRRYHYGYNKRPVIKQKLPKWAKSGYHVKLHPTSSKLKRQVQHELKALNQHHPKNRKGGQK